MEAVRGEKRMEERNKRLVVREERRKANAEKKMEKEEMAARVRKLYAKTVEAIRLKGRGESKEPWEQFRDHWMEEWGKGGHFGKFEDNTAIPPMRLTFSDFDIGYAMDTLQFFSVKVARIDDNLRWPLDVYGFVAVRDILDRKRNMIFCRDRDNCQTINEQVLPVLLLCRVILLTLRLS
ncbi:hypothetical protein QYE76_030365 [Lolium multiflorum]|uniref:DUF6598 domain-containing protein n=1 Tax=Lolium multiflorum TaxID=4521 RepID=A0AAD8VGE9_LOLMU|nr:hypothetical protein QYE76_030365 [Lolium multiflorum]